MTARRVLVVDDDPSICTTVSMLLRLEGFAVATASDGQAGLQAALASPPDLILSDLNMPHLSGHQLLAAVRSSSSLAATRVVLLTGDVDAPGSGDAVAAAPDAWLTKPFSRGQLLELLRALSL